MNALCPVMFVSHGAPSFALASNALTARLNAVGQTLTNLQAIVVISAHWQTQGAVSVMTTAYPETIHDFYGFERQLYDIAYPAKGNLVISHQVKALLEAACIPVVEDNRRGLDHGAWVPLLHLVPHADVPIVQVSIPLRMNASAAIKMGRGLSKLREHGVAIVCSGSLTHNLHEIQGKVNTDYVDIFRHWVMQQLTVRNEDALADYLQQAPGAQRAHPTDEHFIPLLIAFGASNASDNLEIIEGETCFNVIAMDAFIWQ